MNNKNTNDHKSDILSAHKRKRYIAIRAEYDSRGNMRPMECSGDNFDHPIVSLHFDAHKTTQCPYCAKQYITE